MNAYELADALLKNLTMEYDCDDYMKESANMLRQQADRIAELEKAVIAENEACAQILLNSYDTTEPFQEISPDWLLVLVDVIDDRVGRIRE